MADKAEQLLESLNRNMEMMITLMLRDTESQTEKIRLLANHGFDNPHIARIIGTTPDNVRKRRFEAKSSKVKK
jgi:hypothetical protein